MSPRTDPAAITKTQSMSVKTCTSSSWLSSENNDVVKRGKQMVGRGTIERHTQMNCFGRTLPRTRIPELFPIHQRIQRLST
mmetsp:Transcript_29674/g.54639  ORF Transcript_29674/g.54639 Transcript_29674/m.54639 type:complete len:81 (+) Transcript_29674:40-282(+)